MSYKKWVIENADREKASAVSEKLNIDPFISYLLAARGIDTELSATEFLSDSIRLISPFSFKDMDRAVERINRAIDSEERICIYGDYDCDGVTATSLLFTFLESMGADVIYFIPDRLTDGYGMNNNAIDKIQSLGTNLIVTVDNGISAIDEAEYIYSLGMELVVTDHHQIGEKLPRAEAVINPHREDNELSFRDFAGVGVAFKLACALYDGDVDDLLEQYADLVAIGTIGDIVPLVSENRSLVKAGLKLINNDSRLGIAVLKDLACSKDKELSSGDIAFQICPRINAVGRMDKASVAVELLISDDYETATVKAQQLCDENEHRHQVENNIAEDIKNIISENPQLAEDRVIVIAGKGYHKGVIGISASHVAEVYGKPAIVIGIDENGEGTGSARSIEGFNIFDAISSCSDLLTHFGGHPSAAGLGVKEEDIPEFRRRINEYASSHYSVMPMETLHIDCKLSPFYLSVDLSDNISRLEPYGADNRQPVFGLFNMTLKSVTPVGDGKHIRFEAVKKGKIFKIVMFRKTAEEFPYKTGDIIDVAVKISKNLFKGKYYLSIQAVDVHKSSSDFDRYFLEKSDYQLFMLGEKNKTQLYPDREACSQIYKFLKHNKGWAYTDDDLYFALEQCVTLGQLYFALDAFEEAGLIKRGAKIELNQVSQKADLDGTNVLKTLKGRL
ncbi:MAG: single-stranded-DNA-specific exonuclease RecJ [Eubacteriales bacterium]|nr:single-stranded-DNA-specific exonuclease RecJ [Eubacteriales bacterium]